MWSAPAERSGDGALDPAAVQLAQCNEDLIQSGVALRLATALQIRRIFGRESERFHSAAIAATNDPRNHTN